MFYLKTPAKKDGSQLIQLRHFWHGQTLKLSLPIAIRPDDWDPKRRRAKRTFRFAPQFNAILDKWENTLMETYYRLLQNDVPTPGELKSAFDQAMRPNRPDTILAYARKYAEERAAMSPQGSLQIYSRAADLIEGYKPDTPLDDIDIEWMQGFKAYLLKRGYEQNTARKHYQHIQTVLNDAVARGVTSNMRYKSSRVSIPKVETTKIFLDEAELTRIYQTPMPNLDKEMARDAFIVASYTGVRFADLWGIGKDSFALVGGIPHFTLIAEKTRDPIQIPAHPLVIEIMKKHDWKLRKVSNQKYNAHLKEIGKLAGIDQPVVVTSYPGGKRVDTRRPKYELISSHTARRNLICNLYIAGVPVETIKKISGHRSHDAFMAYIRLTPQDHLKVAFKSEFFRAKAQ